MQRTPQRLLLCADVHGAYDVLHRWLAADAKYDGLIIAGDLTTHGTEAEAHGVLSDLSARMPLAIVAGNMDPRPLEPVFARSAALLDGRAAWWGDVALFGVSGSPPTPMSTPYEISEKEIMERAERGWAEAEGARLRVFVPHAPPAGTALDLIHGGRHVGSTSVRTFIERSQPDLVVCGHIHEARGVDRLGRSVVVNCGPAHLGFYAVATIGESISVELKP